jgi:hypothetical protein
MQVAELSPAAQAVVRRYTSEGGMAPQLLGRYGLLAALVGVVPWSTPTLEDYRLLAQVGPLFRLLQAGRAGVPFPQAWEGPTLP